MKSLFRRGGDWRFQFDFENQDGECAFFRSKVTVVSDSLPMSSAHTIIFVSTDHFTPSGRDPLPTPGRVAPRESHTGATHARYDA